MKQVNVFSVRWWNPLFWLYVIVAPFVWAILMAVAAVFAGVAIGYLEGFRKVCSKMEELTKKLQ